MSATIDDLARGVHAVQAAVDAIDRVLRLGRGRVPPELEQRWVAARSSWESFVRALRLGQLAAEHSGPWLAAYRREVVRWADALGRWGLGPSVVVGYVTPSELRDRLRWLNDEVESLHVQLQRVRRNGVTLPPSFLRSFGQYRQRWQRFFGDNRDPYVFGIPGVVAWSPIEDRLDEYQRLLRDYRAQAERHGARFVTPTPREPEADRPQASGGGWLGDAATIAIAGAVGAVAIGAIYMVSKVA